MSRPVLVSFLVFGLTPTFTLARDLSKYRDFQLGTDLLTIAQKTGTNLSEAKVIHRRPALIQELQWYPQSLGPSSRSEPAKDVFFSFHNGELFQIAINYDRHATEGLTAEDLVEVLAATYGIAAKPTALARPTQGRYGDQEDVLAQWEDPQYRFDLIRSSYGPSFRLVGVLKRLEAPVQAAILEAKRLDDQEAPERDAARIASEVEAAKAALEKARLVNKPNFRP